MTEKEITAGLIFLFKPSNNLVPNNGIVILVQHCKDAVNFIWPSKNSITTIHPKWKFTKFSNTKIVFKESYRCKNKPCRDFDKKKPKKTVKMQY